MQVVTRLVRRSLKNVRLIPRSERTQPRFVERQVQPEARAKAQTAQVSRRRVPKGAEQYRGRGLQSPVRGRCNALRTAISTSRGFPYRKVKVEKGVALFARVDRVALDVRCLARCRHGNGDDHA